jgi:hypothetical protein
MDFKKVRIIKKFNIIRKNSLLGYAVCCTSFVTLIILEEMIKIACSNI